ncbi:MAG TPA: N-acetyl-gamma-glutamyl-phosphate reductase [Actinomycetota bacterium]|nr:N-acetyl-gamma-glutamyl-phosphate reductase [Actinomycetota bacterium]
MGSTCSVLGASGYAGGELLRLLAAHPVLEPVALSADARAGEDLASVQPHLAGAFDLPLMPLAAAAAAPSEICFSCLPSGALLEVLDGINARVIVDLADDHRLDEGWIYGLTEFTRSDVARATRVANPGCYPTATLLALVPFVAQGIVGGDAVVDALSGVSGAGRRNDDRLLFSNLVGSVGAYGTTEHRHVPEMERYLSRFGRQEVTISFTPHLVPLGRGLVVTVRARLRSDLDDASALALVTEFYRGEPFVDVIPTWPQTKAVAGTNRAHVSARVDRRAGYLISSAAIDNLGKGAAGQALQNANVALGIDETAGLGALGVWP